MSTSSMAADLVGQTLGGYKLIESIGSGAMATVYKAYQPNLERWVAVKVLHYKETNALVRFQREAKAIALLRHRNILIVYEYGEEQNWPYIIMEYVQGGTLRDHIVAQSMDWFGAVNLIIPVAEALAYAHSQGVIHRDVKPSNILLPQPDWPLLADFGLVKLPTAEESVTRSGTSMGTPAYVAPEQARGAAIDHRSDIYSLGVILFEIVTGRLPFNYSNPNKVLLAHISEPVPSLHHFNPECPPDLEHVIKTMMQKSSDDRYEDMNEIIIALREVMASSVMRPTFYSSKHPPTREDRSRVDTMDFSDPPPLDKSPLPQLSSSSSLPGTAPLSSPSQPAAITPPASRSGVSPLPSPQPQFEARILLTDKNTTLPVPDKDSVVIGRTHRDKLADIDLGPFGAAKVGISRRHARLIRQNNQWFIEDMGSLNGTFVNDVKIKLGNSVLLNNGDVIRCSHMSFVFLISPRM